MKTKPYWIIEANDYHAFDNAVEYYKAAGLKVKYEELGCSGVYHAIFWVGKKPNKYIKDYKKQFE